ncbi:MAG: aspartate aminotransferase family protein [Armatimonadota bacterium]|jgi:4-aminobutyrate aminotransferase/(S)-3-amino-2-methylpropionate transaminase
MPKIITELPGPKSKEILETARTYEPPSMGDQMPVVWDHAEGCVVWDVDGNEFLDWSSGVLVTNVGHCHPRYVEAVKAQCDKLFNCYDFVTGPRAQLAKKLVEITPDYIDRAFLVTTGSDATEAAMRMARRVSDGFEIIGFDGAFHGRTWGAASAGGMMGTRNGYGPMTPGFLHAPFPYLYRAPLCRGKSEEEAAQACLEYLDWMVSRVSSNALCAVITEPYQGGAGGIIPPKSWMEGLFKWAKERDLIFILDEVQSSFGRTGKMFCMEHWDIQPDLITLGKGLGSGIPCSAVIGTSEIMDALPEGSMGSTNGGNPISSIAALTAIEIIEQEGLVENSAKMGDLFEARFRKIQQRFPQLGDIRVLGLMGGLEFVKDPETREPAPELTRQIVWESFQRGLIMIAPIGLCSNVIRVAPPLVITEEQANETLDIFEEAFEAALAEVG